MLPGPVLREPLPPSGALTCILRLLPSLTYVRAASGQSSKCQVQPYRRHISGVWLGTIHVFPQPAVRSISPPLLLPQASVSSSVQWGE